MLSYTCPIENLRWIAVYIMVYRCYHRAMKKLVVVADDFGLCESVNSGIVESFQNGLVTELSLMLGSPGTNHALKLVQNHNISNLGIHMLLKNWRDTGALVRRADYTRLFNELTASEVAKLVTAELDEFERLTGHKPSHITSQYGILSHPKALPSITEYAAENDIPMRQPKSVDSPNLRDPTGPEIQYIRERHVRTTDYFLAHIDDVKSVNEAEEAFENDLAAIPENSSVEICLHPGKVGDELRSLTSLVDERVRDLELATNPTFRHWLEQNSFELSSYADI